MAKRHRRKRYIGATRQSKNTEQLADKKKSILSKLSEKERGLYERIRASLIPNDLGIVAGVVQHPVSRMWQGWISDGSQLIFISARKDIEQAYTDVEELLELVEGDDFNFDDAFRLWENSNTEDDLPPEALPEHTSKGLLYFIRIIYAVGE